MKKVFEVYDYDSLERINEWIVETINGLDVEELAYATITITKEEPQE